MQDFDVVIVGGGLVGASLAIALDGSPLRVALAEAVPARANLQPSYDERNLALARASVNALTNLGVWNHVAASATPIRKIHVSRRGEFGAVRLDAMSHGFDSFGAVLPARELGNGLLARLDECRTLTRLAPAKLSKLTSSNDAMDLQFSTENGETRTRARLLVGADGTESFVRTSLAVGVDRTDYAQTAFVATVTCERNIDCAYERFTATGPVALLPLGERRAGVVLTVPSADSERVAALDDAGFVAELHHRFGWRLGKLSRPGRRVSYPLNRVQAQRLWSNRAVLVGNAAQTLHPIAAQGFNLGLRDALTLAELLRADPNVDLGAPELLHEYAQRRDEDRKGTISMSDGLARWSADESVPLKILRSFAMLALDRVMPLQNALVRRGMGFRGRTSEFALESKA